MKVSIEQSHHQIIDWKRELEFYKEEIDLLEKRLTEVIAKNTNQEVLASAEHFQNKFLLLKESQDRLHDVLNAKKAYLEKQAAEVGPHIHHKILEESVALNEEIQYFSKSISELRLEFNTFLAKVF